MLRQYCQEFEWMPLYFFACAIFVAISSSNKCEADGILLFDNHEPNHHISTFTHPLHIVLPSYRRRTSVKVISSINSYHQLFNWSITPAPHLLNASLINYRPPRGREQGGCQPEFFRLRWIFVVFLCRRVRAHQLVLKHIHFAAAKMGCVPITVLNHTGCSDCSEE